MKKAIDFSDRNADKYFLLQHFEIKMVFAIAVLSSVYKKDNEVIHQICRDCIFKHFLRKQRHKNQLRELN